MDHPDLDRWVSVAEEAKGTGLADAQVANELWRQIYAEFGIKPLPLDAPLTPEHMKALQEALDFHRAVCFNAGLDAIEAIDRDAENDFSNPEWDAALARASGSTALDGYSPSPYTAGDRLFAVDMGLPLGKGGEGFEPGEMRWFVGGHEEELE